MAAFPLQFDREHFSEVFVDLKWFESKVGNKYLNEAAGLAAEKEAAQKNAMKDQVGTKRNHRFSSHNAVFPVIDISYDVSRVKDPALRLTTLTSSEKVIGEGRGGGGGGADDEEEEDDMFETEFRQYKRTYYMSKMAVDVVSE